MMAVKKIISKKVYAVYWQDAAYSFQKSLPKKNPNLEITTGLVISQNKKLINIATNVNYNPKEGTFIAKDGFLIPRKTILKIKKIGNL